jgi:lactate dehydrogenase-like 2-hydroxyacid dehydrogenase
MPTNDLLLMCPFPDWMMSDLGKDFTLHRFWESDDKAAFLAQISDRVRFVATEGHHGCPASVIEALPKLELIASFGVGYDAVDVGAARAAGVRVTNTPDVLNDAVAEMTLALMLALCRRVPSAERYIREGHWPEANYGLTEELTGRTAGILGLGRIGKEIARRLQAFKMQVVYHGRRRQLYEPYRYYDDLESMARDVDWLIVIAPGSTETRRIVSRQVLEALGEKGCLVNVARGTLVDEAAMVELLGSRRLGGAALDVFEGEPHVPEALWHMDNVVLSPHQGSATHKTRHAMGALVVANLHAQLHGDPLLSPVI